MDSINLIDSFAEFKEFKNIDRVTMMGVLEEVFRAMVRKANGTDDNVDVIINVDKGDLELWINKEIVKDGEVEDPALEIELSKALKIEADFEVGEEIAIEVKIEDFGRRNILALRQNLINKVMELEKDNVFKKYKDKIGELLTGEVYQIWKREMLILDEEGNELILPKSEQIPGDFFKKGDTIRTVVERVDHTNNSPKIILSRTSGAFLERLFELEIPEIFDGLITIKKIVRTPGDRAKVAVESYDDRVDPVGACIGMKGARIHGIVRELRNENIDVINYTENVKLLIQRALSPAKVGSVELVEDTGRANVYLHPDEVSKAIGRGGQNIKLAGKLTGYEIDVYREGAEDIEDVDLGEFADEIESWVIDELKAIGCDSAKSVLAIGKEDLIKRTDLEDETIDDVLKVLKSEFE
jgi:transcription termination/antitermination protein NusA